jgi:hypothetical protein
VVKHNLKINDDNNLRMSIRFLILLSSEIREKLNNFFHRRGRGLPTDCRLINKL